MTIRVKMYPHLSDIEDSISGIDTVIRAWFKHLQKYDIELVDKKSTSYDVFGLHAGMADSFPKDIPLVSHLHGLYWTNDYKAQTWEWKANENVINSIRYANQVTVPSLWVAETIARDVRLFPHIIPHGIDWDSWQHSEKMGNYVVVYAKNRAYADVCDPTFITELARRFSRMTFVATFAPPDAPSNVRVTGVLPHEQMKILVQRAAVVVSPIKETFGMLNLEAMAAGAPILGYNYGGNRDLIQHGVTGYLACPGDIDALAEGLVYCMQNAPVLGANARQVAKSYTWESACESLAAVYALAAKKQEPLVSVVIPCYNYGDEERLGRAIESVRSQTVPVHEIVVIDDGSPDNGATQSITEKHGATYIRQANSGVAVARNRGIAASSGKYIICIDPDDAIAPQFVEACLPALEDDPSLGIAYTGLLTKHKDGRTEVSAWPGKFDYDSQARRGGQNQVPTCCMFRQEMWKRLGGYRERYCPTGAGSEDAEFWLRAGAAGWNAKKVTDAPLFIYSFNSGHTSKSGYREVDWRALHPWTADGKHPLASVAKPANNRYSHPVRQYDEPQISIIIPVGPGHGNQVFNALDSLESQIFRNWEVIVVNDTGSDASLWEFNGVPNAIDAYPYVRLITTEGKRGAGYARNMGADVARSDMLLFLDADDNLLMPEALDYMLETWVIEGAIVYSDYIGKAFVTPEEADKLSKNGRLIEYNHKTGLVMTRHFSSDYDCQRAVKQPENPLYIWNLITSLVPKSWHNAIGGFDEKMPSWEDWDYWLRMARAGFCFVKLSEPLVAYRFYTGTRREDGQQIAQELLSYIESKYKEPPMPCGCKKGATVTPNRNATPASRAAGERQVEDSDVVMIIYQSPNRGQHRVVGPVTKRDYGHRAGGGQEQFYVMRQDQAASPNLFVIRGTGPVIVEEKKETPPAELIIAAEPIKDEYDNKEALDFLGEVFDPQSIPGVTKQIAAGLAALGCKSISDVSALNNEALMQIDGMNTKRASSIMAFARKQKMKKGEK